MSREAAVTVAFGDFGERLDETFTSFARNKHLELHAFIVGDRLPERRLPGVNYHLKAPDSRYSHPLRDAVYRRWEFIDDLDVEYAVVVDNSDVLCLQDLPPISQLLRGAAFGACVEHMGSRYLSGQGYTSNYINCGVTFWHVPSTRSIRQEILERGRAQFRNIDDQLSINEVMQAKYYDKMVLLPCQYNFRACIGPRQKNGAWVDHLDGVVLYHNRCCLERAKALSTVVKARAVLPSLEPDEQLLTRWGQTLRRVRQWRNPHIISQQLSLREKVRMIWHGLFR